MVVRLGEELGKPVCATGEYASIPEEMGAVAAYFGRKVLREVDEAELLRALPELRRAAGRRRTRSGP